MRGDFLNHYVFSRTARAVMAAGWGVTLLLASAAHADPAPPARSYAADNPSLEGWVEDEMQAMMGSCVGGRLKMLKKKAFGGSEEVAISAVPPLISDGLKLGLKPQITLQNGGSLTREFAYVRSDVNDASFDNSDLNALALNFTNTNDQLPTVGLDQTNYVATCASVLSAKATAGGDFSFPMATVKAGLDADYSKSNSYSISMVAGHFESPIVAMYNGLNAGDASSADSAYAALLFWNWYDRNRGKIAQTQHILRYFDGVSLYMVAGFKKKDQFSVNISSGASSPFVSGSAESKLSLNQLTEASLTGYRSVVNLSADGKPARDYFELPQLDELRDVVAERADVLFDAAASDDRMLVSGDKKISEIAFSGPSAMCDPTQWKTDDARVAVTGAAIEVARKRQACKFSLLYKPTAADRNEGAQLKFALVTKAAIGTPAKPIAVPAPLIAYQGTRRPSLDYVSGTLMPTVTPLPGPLPNSTLSWRINYRLVTDPSARVTTTDNIDTTNLALTCPRTVSVSSAPAYTITFEGPQNGNGRNLWIGVTAQYIGPTPDPSKLDGFDTCVLSGTLDYTIAGLQAPVSRSAPPVNLAYPTTPAAR
jgi:hypothetical protein